MEEQEYQTIYALEDTHWWYVGLRSLVNDFIGRLLKDRARTGRLKVLDAGCGAGALLKDLEANYAATGLDFSTTALKLCRKRGINALVQGSITEMPFKDGSFDLVVSLDVIYHSGVTDDVTALMEVRRVLKDGGYVILNLPAFEFLRGPHDRVVHTRRRYTKKELAHKISMAGLSVEKISYWNTLLFPAVASVKLAKKLFSKRGPASVKESDLEEVPAILNRFFLGTLMVENRLQRRISMPFGTSVFCVARKFG